MYQPADTIIVAPPMSNAPSRFHTPKGAATRKARARPGTTRKACNIFVRNAKPIAQPVSAIHVVIRRAVSASMARTVQYAATTSSSTSSASGLL